MAATTPSISADGGWAAPQVMARLVSYQDARVEDAEASRTPAGRLRHHAADPDPRVRAAAAENLRCPAGTLEHLTGDVAASVRVSVAGNPNCPVELLDRLAADTDTDVREMVAQQSTSPETLTLLAGDDNGWVRVRVAGNVDCPADVLTGLESDPYVLVYDALAANPAVPAGLAQRCAANADPDVRSNVAARASAANAGLFAALAADADADVRVMVAMNGHCPADLLATLAADADTDVRRGVAWRPSCPTAVRAKLATDIDRHVRSEAIPHLAVDVFIAAVALVRGLCAVTLPRWWPGKAAA